MGNNELQETARALVSGNKGLLAADESLGTIDKRFRTINLPSTEQNRRRYREMLFTTPGLGKFISGTILFDETIRQQSRDGVPLVEVLTKQGIIPGIKVDKGAKDLALFPGEKVTEGLDGLRERLAEYRDLGARFTKWRAVIVISEATPSDFAITANMQAMARFAALSQEQGLVPITEPEVLMDGGHSIEACLEATVATLNSLYRELFRHRVRLDGTVLKTNMVLPGKEAGKVPAEEVAEWTLRALRETVPPAVPGIAFLSGGQGDEEATENLDAINRLAGDTAPWELSFSYGRALQQPALKAWRGEDGNVEAAQGQLYKRAKLNYLAHAGRYDKQQEQAA